ncbi:O-antigen ligase family protein [Ammoniphilus sp. 3BR4]|uniref:O-antigen ligase family protein n=1 Tax=Ammoniphilus sp. 3BR4 TaxID=3158265 RepID=UPI003466C88E
MNYFIVSALAFLFILSPFSRGLFFEADFYLIHFFVYLLFISWVVKLFVVKENFYFPGLSIFLITITYLISFFTAESPQGNFDNLLRWLNYSAVFVMLVSISRDQKLKEILPHLIAVLALVLSSFAVLGYFKLVDYPDVILIDHLGNSRFTSVFQYGNTFAAVVGAFWVFSLVWLTDRENSIWTCILLALPMALYPLDLFHTYSRGALLVFPIAWITGLILLPFSRQLIYVLYTLISLGSGFLLFRIITGTSLVMVSIITLTTAGVILLISQLNRKFGWKLNEFNKVKFSRYFLTLAAGVAGFLLFLDLYNQGFVYKQLPTAFQERISDISTGTYSVQGRSMFAQDAMKIVKDHPFTGVGGEGWRVLFTKYQEIPYWSNETHNGYLEVLLNTGLLGLGVFLVVFGFFFFNAIRNLGNSNLKQYTYTRAAIPALVMIFVHSFLDFNFSYGTVWYIVLFLLAIAMDTKRESTTFSRPAIYYTTLSGLLILVTIFSFYSLKFYSANQTLATIKNGQVTEELVNKLIDKNPYSTEHQYIASSANMQLFEQTQQEQYKQKLLEQLVYMENLEPNNARLLFNVGVQYVQHGEFDKGLEYFNKSLIQDHYNVDLYQNIMKIKSDIMRQYLGQDHVKAQEYAHSIVSDYEQMNKWHENMVNHPVQMNERNYHIPTVVRLYAGQALLVQKRYEEVIAVIEQAMGDQEADIRLEIQALLAAAYQLNGEQEKSQQIINGSLIEFPQIQQKVQEYLAFIQ